MAMRSSYDDDGNEIKRRRDRATATRSSDGDEIECILSHEADEIQTRNLKMSNPQQEAQVLQSISIFSDAAIMMILLYCKIDSWWSLFATLRRMAIS
ncbi:hypothetical protein Bca4012_032228 [Brassica carinata]|uniref:(rape) hypothetical protein n=1 Tax=Brassica napus TaxID=3708 RepID=A0A078HLC0_BRANA|nr:unnamed protein product [Brassica napus]CDY37658.1 BnaC04g30000D [Brassica napus]